MKKLILILSVVFVVIPLNYCFGDSSKSTTDITGLWISTPETTAKFPHGTQKIVLQICRDNNEELTTRSIFLWNGNYQSEWKLVNIQYDKITRSITILASDENTVKGV